MSRAVIAMLACLICGAGGMWLASNFKLKLEPVGQPEAAQPAPVAEKPVPNAEPEKLPAHIVGRANTPTGDVRQAGFADPVVLPPLAPPPVLAESIVEISETIGTQAITWNTPKSGRLLLATDKAILYYSLLVNDSKTPTVLLNSAPVPANVISYAGFALTFKLSELPAGRPDLAPGKPLLFEIVRQSTDMLPKKFSSTITLIRPLPNSEANQFFIDQASMAKLLPPSNLSSATVAVKNDFFRVRGRGFGSFDAAAFYIVAGNKATEPDQANRSTRSAKPEEWEYELRTKPQASNTTATLLARGDFSGGHIFALAEGRFQFTRDPDPLPAPKAVIAKATSDTNMLRLLSSPTRLDRTGLDTIFTNARKFRVTVTADARAQAIALFVDDSLIKTLASTGSAIPFEEIDIPEGKDHVVRVEAILANSSSPGTQIALSIVTSAPAVEGVAAPALGQSGGIGNETIRIRFARSNPLDKGSVETKGNFAVANLNPADTADRIVASSLDEIDNAVVLTVGKIVAGSYAIRVATGLKDIYGNTVAQAFEATLQTNSVDAPQSSQTAGVTALTGKNAVFPEYTNFRELKDGFNPSDRVETRVVRLYYYRDAHRVAQIVNRDVRSYNGPAVDVRRRAADKVRNEADSLQDQRQSQERAAIRAAVATRQVENEVRQLEDKLQQARTDQATSKVQLGQREQQLTIAQRELDRIAPSSPDLVKIDPSVEQQREKILQMNDDIARTQNAKAALPPGDPRIADFATRVNQLTFAKEQQERALDVLLKNATASVDRTLDSQRNQVKSLEAEVAKLRLTQSNAEASQQTTQGQLDAARSKVQGLRAEEIKLTEAALGKDSEERRKREEQFRREVAAALADPDSYVAGLPESVDPVLQCSVSVIGEGLIQIRGPVKGLNIIRTMINQIDAPVGQVRVGVHTVQVNGERVEKMDQVIGSIQRYLDHSRFLTTQSAQMLRKAVTTVASRKAMEAEQTLGLGCTQADRDMKYLHCFFGKDFIDELKSLDSEFLKTGNKILSLHSMDSTSLSSALFLMSLAKNDIRQEILDEFKRQVQGKLPEAELNFYIAGLSCPTKCEAHTDRKFCVLAQNAKFESLFGFFNSEVIGNDTLSPLQREFVRLAQIFKARMVTEMELKQRVMERSILEDRVGNYREEQIKAKAKEEASQLELETATKTRSKASAELADGISQILTQLIADIQADSSVTSIQFTDELNSINQQLTYKDGVNDGKPFYYLVGNDTRTFKIAVVDPNTTLATSIELLAGYENIYEKMGQVIANFKRFKFTSAAANAELAFLEKVFADHKNRKKDKLISNDDILRIPTAIGTVGDAIQSQLQYNSNEILQISLSLGKPKSEMTSLYSRFSALSSDSLRRISDPNLSAKIQAAYQQVNQRFSVAIAADVRARQADESARSARRSLDEKKLLDMLVDEMEDKYIELLDGTRAHTANVDNYLKALSTALDDDFMTQFYNPAFRKVRSLGASWDVQLGQIESTTVLTNNRSFGKVSPTASMEFDLPRRDILIKEAFKSAKAAVQDYGALLNDPVFLSMVKMYGGAPMGAQFGGAGGLSAVRNILPGLPGSSDEMIMSRAGSNRKEFGTNLESLIADPAIYKIETGTGYEIRPVISPDGQAVVFGFDYMYTTDVREPVRADEKHLGRVKRHFVHTDVQLSNFEMREVSKYWVSAKIARTSKGVSLLQDIPVAGALFRPAPSAGSSLQQNIIYSQAAIFPTLFDLMGLRYAPAIADVTPENLINDEFVVRGRRDYLRAFIFDYGASRVDDALRIMYGERRADLYRSQYTIPHEHPNGYRGPGLRQRDSELQEGYDPVESFPSSKFAPGMRLPPRGDRNGIPQGVMIPGHPEPLTGKPWIIEQTRPGYPAPPKSELLPGPKTLMPKDMPNYVIPPKGPAPVSPPPPLPLQGQPIRTGPVPLPPNPYFPK